MWNPIKYVKTKFLKDARDKILAPIDTKEERDKMVAEVVTKKGLPEWAASGLSLVLAVLLEAMQSVDVSLILTDPKTFGKVLLSAVAARLLMQLQKPGTVVTEHKDAKGNVLKKEEVVNK